MQTDRFLTIPFSVAITMWCLSSNSLTLTKASTFSLGSQPIKLTIARPLAARPLGVCHNF